LNVYMKLTMILEICMMICGYLVTVSLSYTTVPEQLLYLE